MYKQGHSVGWIYTFQMHIILQPGPVRFIVCCDGSEQVHCGSPSELAHLRNFLAWEGTIRRDADREGAKWSFVSGPPVRREGLRIGSHYIVCTERGGGGGRLCPGPSQKLWAALSSVTKDLQPGHLIPPVPAVSWHTSCGVMGAQGYFGGVPFPESGQIIYGHKSGPLSLTSLLECLMSSWCTAVHLPVFF